MPPPSDEDPPFRRTPWVAGPEPAAATGWLALDDDDLLFRIERLTPEHGEDEALMEVVRSLRHFFGPWGSFSEARYARKSEVSLIVGSTRNTEPCLSYIFSQL